MRNLLAAKLGSLAAEAWLDYRSGVQIRNGIIYSDAGGFIMNGSAQRRELCARACRRAAKRRMAPAGCPAIPAEASGGVKAMRASARVHGRRNALGSLTADTGIGCGCLARPTNRTNLVGTPIPKVSFGGEFARTPRVTTASSPPFQHI
jgi:hypothetical protein